VVLLRTCKRFSSLFLQAFTGIQTKNRFAVKNSLGQQCYFAHEGDEIMGLVIRKNEVHNIYLRVVENYLRWQKRNLLLSSTWECSKHCNGARPLHARNRQVQGYFPGGKHTMTTPSKMTPRSTQRENALGRTPKHTKHLSLKWLEKRCFGQIGKALL